MLEIYQGPATWEMAGAVLYPLSVLIGAFIVIRSPHKYTAIGKAVFPFIWIGILMLYALAGICLLISFIPLVAGELLAIMVFKDYKLLNRKNGRKLGLSRFQDDDSEQ